MPHDFVGGNEGRFLFNAICKTRQQYARLVGVLYLYNTSIVSNYERVDVFLQYLFS